VLRGPSLRKPRDLVVAAAGSDPAGDHKTRKVGESAVLKKLLIVAGIVGVAALVLKKVKASSDERALWHEATTAPDLR
jgi:hypothetical protein